MYGCTCKHYSVLVQCPPLPICSACVLHDFLSFSVSTLLLISSVLYLCIQQKKSKDVRHAKHKITPRTGHRVDIRKRVWLHTPHTHAPRAQSPAPRRASVHHSASPSQPVDCVCLPPYATQRSAFISPSSSLSPGTGGRGRRRSPSCRCRRV